MSCLLLQGLYKSTVMCQHCDKKSVKFDSFMYLTLPIPSPTRCSLAVSFALVLQHLIISFNCFGRNVNIVAMQISELVSVGINCLNWIYSINKINLHILSHICCRHQRTQLLYNLLSSEYQRTQLLYNLHTRVIDIF